jgi:hypothetical protein
MKLTQLDDLARIKPHFALKKMLVGGNILAFVAFMSGVGSNDYFTPGHTNAYCLMFGYCSTLIFTMGAGSFYGL